MTQELNRYQKSTTRQASALLSCAFSLLFLCFVFSLSLFFSEQISSAIKESLNLLATVIIPSIFPFMIISDMIVSFVDFTSIKWIGAAFERFFKINRAGSIAFLTGILCGFPLGVRCSVKLYESGRITKEECERLIGFSNNTGPAFIVSGIGAGLFGNIRVGICIYVCMVASAIFTGIIFSFSKNASVTHYTSDFSKKPFDLTRSIKDSAESTINVCAYILAFSFILAVIRALITDSVLYTLLIPFLEISNAASFFAKAPMHPGLALSFCAFSVGFSGICVHLQAKSFAHNANLSFKKYYVMKLTQGFILAAMVYLSVIILGTI